MKEFFDIIIKYLHSEILQGGDDLSGVSKIFCRNSCKVQTSLEDETIFYLDEALAQFCENYGMEYDADVFYGKRLILGCIPKNVFRISR